MDLLIKYLNSVGSEYQITTSTGVVCLSEKYDDINNSKSVATDMYIYDKKYYHKKYQTLEIDRIIYEICVYVDVTRYANEIIKSKIDCLTKLPNRTQIQEYLSKITSECVVVMCDIDDFKKVNDVYGHQTGDNVIRLVGDLIRSIIGKNDFAGRYGGEEFLVIFNTANVESVKEKMDNFNIFLNMYTSSLKLSSSIGIHKYEPSIEQIEEAIGKADKALYFVKHNGKNASLIYEDMKKYGNM